MAFLGSYEIDDYLTFYTNTHIPSTGAAGDADSVPTYRIYEDETATPLLTGSMALLDASNTDGFYSERVQLTAANGFELNKCYSVRIAATAESVSAASVHTFQVQDIRGNVTAILADTGTDGVVLKAAGLATDAVSEIVDAVLASALKTNVDAILADTGTDGVVLKAAGLNADAVDEILDEVVEGSTTLRQAMRLLLAFASGKCSGGGTATITFRDIGDTKNRIVATVDENGNRTAVDTRDGS